MKKTIKKLISLTCIAAMLVSSISVCAAGYEVTMEPTIDYVDGKIVIPLEEDSYEYELFGSSIERTTFFYPTPFRQGVSVVHNNVQLMFGGMGTYYPRYSYVVDVYGNTINIGEYDAFGVYRWDFDEDPSIYYGLGYEDYTSPAINPNEGIDKLGYITVSKNGKGGLIDANGNMIIPCEYDDLYDVFESYNIDYTSSNENIPYEGKYFAPYYDPYYYFEYDDDGGEIHCYYNGLAVVAQTEDENSKVGIVDENDNIVVPFIYDMITPCYDNACWVLKDGKWGIIRVSNSKVAVIVNNNPLTFDQNPLVINGRTLAPVRAIFEALGATVEWKNDTREVISTKGNTTITMAIDNTTMYKNGEAITLDVAPQIIGERTLVPVRAIAEAFNCKVEWNNDTQTVIITE